MSVVPIDAGRGATTSGRLAKQRETRDALILSNLALVRSIAQAVHRHLPAQFQLDDLIASGYVGLIHAATRYRPRKHGGTPFAGYARQVIRGAILDSVRRRHYRAETAVSLDAVPERAGAVVSIDSAIDVFARERLAKAVQYLEPGERKVIEMYYSGAEPRLQDVADELGTTRAEVGARRASAVVELRRRLAA